MSTPAAGTRARSRRGCPAHEAATDPRVDGGEAGLLATGRAVRARWLRRACLVVACAFWGAAGSLRAESLDAGPGAKVLARTEPIVTVREPSCREMPVAFDAFAEALQVELAGRAPAAGSGAEGRAPGSVEVLVAPRRCGSLDARVTVEVLDLPAGRQRRRELSLADVSPSARPRALALMVAEIVRSLVAEAPQGPLPPPRAPAPRPPLTPPPPTHTSPSPSTHTLTTPSTQPTPSFLPSRSLLRGASADLELRHYTRTPSTFGGARAAVLLGIRHSRWTAEPAAGFLYARRHLELGDVTLQAPTLGLTVGPWFGRGPLVLQLAGRGEVGLAFVAGRSARADVGSGSGSNVTLGLGLAARAELPMARTFRAALGVELGATLRGITAQAIGEPAATLRGPYGLVSLGVRWSR